jgi:hypothetical protein
MLANEVLLFGMIGLFTSAFTSYFISGIKEQKTIILCSLQGAFTGWLSGMMWVYLTGGLDVTLYALVMPVLISAFFTILLLQRLPLGTEKQLGKGTTIIAGVAFFALILFVAFSSVPTIYSSSVNTESFSVSALDWNPNQQVVSQTTGVSTMTVPMTIDYSKSSVGIFGVMSEDATPSSSIQFKVYFKPDAEWTKPYITISVYTDTDNNGKLSQGDVLWSDSSYEVGTAFSNWRTNCLWENGVATYNMQSYNGEPLPIFHANTISQVKNDANVQFINAMGYAPQNDMLTWENGVLKEQVIDYANVAPGQTSTIQGKIFCGPDATQNNIIVVKAYSASFTDPFSSNQPSVAEQVIPFTVSSSATETTVMGFPPVFILIGLGALFGVAVFYTKKEGMW